MLTFRKERTFLQSTSTYLATMDDHNNDNSCLLVFLAVNKQIMLYSHLINRSYFIAMCKLSLQLLPSLFLTNFTSWLSSIY